MSADPMTFIREGVEDLGAYLAMWATRDQAPTAARAAAGQAVERIDVTVRGMQRLRSQLVGEIRASDEAVGAPTDALLDPLTGDDGGAAEARLQQLRAIVAEPYNDAYAMQEIRRVLAVEPPQPANDHYDPRD